MADRKKAPSIDDLIRQAAADPRVIGLAGGLPSDAQFPRRELAASFLRAVSRQGAPALQYGWPEGLDTLREKIAARLCARGGGLKVTADEVIVTSGAQQAIAIAAQLVVRPGDPIGVDAVSYPAALDLFRARGLRPAPFDEARAVYVMPAVSNPEGVGMSKAARAALLRRKAWIIEDDAYADLRFDGPPPPPLLAADRTRVLHIGTFSKTLCPGLRVGWLVVPPKLRRRALRIKQTDDLQSNSLSQAVVDDYLAHVDFDARLVALRRFYRRRATRLANALRRALPAWRFRFPEGGFGLWVQTDAAVDERRLLAAAVASRVSFDPGSGFSRRADGARPAPPALRLCFSLAPPQRFEEGARQLARAWRRATV